MEETPKRPHGRATLPPGDPGRLRSEDLAAIIVDALLRANVVAKCDVERALAIATEEVDVRKSLGDY